MLKKILCFLLILCSTSIFAKDCLKTFTQINADIERFGLQIKDRHLSWASLNSLEQVLGQPQIKSIHATLYQWRNFQLLTRSDGLNESVGDFPSKTTIGPPSFNEAVQVLGQPQKNFSETISELTWHCNQSSLIATTTENNLLTIKLNFCNENHCQRNLAFFDKSALENKMNQMVLTDINQVERQMIAASIKMYNDYFRENVQNEIELETKMVEKYKNFYSHLRQCQRGHDVYVYIHPMTMHLVVAEATLSKLRMGDCSLVDSQEVAGIGKIVKQCQFTAADLPLFSDQAAELAGKGNISYDSEKLTPLQQLEKNKCKYFLNGELTQSI